MTGDRGDPVRFSVEGGIARIALARPERRNAFDDALIAALAGHFDRVERDDRVRAVILAAEGPVFCSGADLAWMQRMAATSVEENEADARRLAAMLAAIDRLPQPVVALVQGSAFGGGVGLVAVCDIAIASSDCTFALSEVKLGLVPATIAPYVTAAIGVRAARRYMLSGERFDAVEAERIGLVHAVVAPSDLEAEGRRIVEGLLANGPHAVRAAKRLIRMVRDRSVDARLIEATARLLAEVRTGWEAREGIAAFLEKRPPAWKR